MSMSVSLGSSFFSKPRRVLLVIGVLGLALVAGGLVLARTMNLAACPLCILQRMLYLLVSLEVTLTLLVFRKQAMLTFPALFIAATAGLGVWIAAYQTWLQRFATDVSCSANQPWWEQLVYWAGEKSPLLFEATGLCSEAGWKFLSLSIAEWSLVMFCAMFGGALRAAWLARR